MTRGGGAIHVRHRLVVGGLGGVEVSQRVGEALLGGFLCCRGSGTLPCQRLAVQLRRCEVVLHALIGCPQVLLRLQRRRQLAFELCDGVVQAVHLALLVVHLCLQPSYLLPRSQGLALRPCNLVPQVVHLCLQRGYLLPRSLSLALCLDELVLQVVHLALQRSSFVLHGLPRLLHRLALTASIVLGLRELQLCFVTRRHRVFQRGLRVWQLLLPSSGLGIRRVERLLQRVQAFRRPCHLLGVGVLLGAQ